MSRRICLSGKLSFRPQARLGAERVFIVRHICVDVAWRGHSDICLVDFFSVLKNLVPGGKIKKAKGRVICCKEAKADQERKVEKKRQRRKTTHTILLLMAAEVEKAG